MNSIIADTSNAINIGRLGENQYTRVAFDVSEYLSEFPSATFQLLNCRPGDVLAYPVANIDTDGQYLYWNVTSTDLTVQGVGRCEFVVMDGEVIVKSVIYKTIISEALDGNGEAPGPWESWLEKFYEYAEEASGSAQAAAESASDASGSAEAARQSGEQAAGSAEAAAGSASAAHDSEETATAKAEAAAESARLAAELAQTASSKAGEAAESASNAGNSAESASVSSADALTNALKSEGFSVGQQNGSDVHEGSPFYQNNSKYYSEQAAASAAAAAQHSMGVSVSGNTLVFTNNVKEVNE